jgi:GTPase SAR1 family protein
MSAAAKKTISTGPAECVDAILVDLLPHKKLLSSLFAYFEQCKRTWSTRTWRVGLLGITSCGKSTLVNGMFGLKIIPARVKPSSNRLILSRRGEGPRGIIHYKDKKPEEVTEMNLAERLAAVGDEHNNPRNRLGVEEIELFAPNFLLSPDTVIVDTPGLGAYGYYDTHETLTLHTFLPTVDLVVFVTTATANSDKEIVNYLKDIKGAGKPVILVQNKIDTVEAKLGLHGVVNKTKEVVRQEHRERANRIALDALGGGHVAVHQVAAERAMEGDFDRSGIRELAEAIEAELRRLGPRLNVGRYSQLRAELERIRPRETEEEEASALEAEATQLTRHRSKVNELGRWMKSALIGPRQRLWKEARKLLNDVAQIGKHDVDDAEGIKTRLHAWADSVPSALHDFVKKRAIRMEKFAEEIGQNPDDYLMPKISGDGKRSLRLQVWDNYETEWKDAPGPLNWIKRKFGWGGKVEVKTVKNKELDIDSFVADVEAAIKASREWFDKSCKELAAGGEAQLSRLSEELNRRKNTLNARRSVVLEQKANRQVRGCIGKWTAKLDLVIAGRSPVSGPAPDNTGVSAPSDPTAEIQINRSAYDFLRLGDIIAKNLLLAARDAVLKRTSTFRDAIIVGWDRDALETFLCRFWFDRLNVNVNCDKPVLKVNLVSPPGILFVVNESKVDSDDDPIIAEAASSPLIFLLLDINQTGAAQTALSRSFLVKKGGGKDVCLVFQSLRGFFPDRVCSVEDLVEGLREGARIALDRDLKVIGVLANDDDISLSALSDRLLHGPKVSTLKEEQDVVASMTGLMNEDLAAKIVRQWRDTGTSN